jgi:hypothetical protein
MKTISNIFYSILFLFVPSCEKISLINSRRCDDELSSFDKIRSAIHMTFCKSCTRYNEQIELIHRVLHRHCHGHLHQMAKVDLSDETKNAIKHQISI